MANDSIPVPTREQESNDILIAHSELRSAQNRYQRVLDHAQDPSQFNGSVYFAKLQVQAAERILNNLIKYYASVDFDDADPAPAANGPPTKIIDSVINIEDSDDEDAAGTAHVTNSSPGPAPAYTSWPPTPPHFYAALVEERRSQAPELPVTPKRRSRVDGSSPPWTQAPVPVTPGASTGPSHSATAAPPATPSHSNHKPTTIVGEDGLLTSPTPQKKHYIVTKGRRTGIYRAWAVAHAYIEGLGTQAVWQSFDTYKEAFEVYMSARERGLLSVVRLPGDTVEKYGPIESAEDI